MPSTSRDVRNGRHPITWRPGLPPVAGVHSSAVALTNGFDLAFLVGMRLRRRRSDPRRRADLLAR